MSIHNELPVSHLHLDLGHAAAWPVATPRSAIDKGAGISRIMQHLKNTSVRRWRPQQLPFVWAPAQPSGKQDALVQKVLDRPGRTAEALECGEHQAKRRLHFSVGVEIENAVGPVDQADGRTDAQFTATSFIDLAAAHAGFEEVKLSLAHGAFEPEEQPIVEAAGRRCRLRQGSECGYRAEFEKPMPVSRIAG